MLDLKKYFKRSCNFKNFVTYKISQFDCIYLLTYFTFFLHETLKVRFHEKDFEDFKIN